MGDITLETAVAEVEGIPARAQKALAKAGLNTAGDLVRHFPHRYEDRRRFDGFPHGETAAPVCLHGLIVDCGVRRMGYRRFAEIRIEDAAGSPLSQPIYGRWFNMSWISRNFAAGQEIVLFGRVKEKNSRLVIDHPDFEIIEPDCSGTSIHMNRIVPVYPLRDGLNQKTVRESVHEVVRRIDWSSVPEVVPDQVGNVGAGALRDIHFPDDLDAARRARDHLAFEEFFALQINVLNRRRHFVTQAGTAHGGAGELAAKWEAALPFALTGAQRRAISEVWRDMAGAQPMNRLLQGDVGSGKTAVALAAALLAVESGSQVALMAPTQILAEQHFLNFRRQLEPLGVRVGLRTAARREESFLPLFEGLDDSPQIVIGTHALLFDDQLFENLGLVIIDEQHKFGVAQRARLVRAGRAPDVLVMTATPIPRTLALTVYGDLDISVLDEMPAGRGKLTTAVRTDVDHDQVAAFIRQQLEKGRQGYIVYPLVEESDKLAVKAAVTEYENWCRRLEGVPVGLLHGRLKPEEKDAVMSGFREGRTLVLVCTTVVEVGVDVPNASLMLVFNAERFGLAQLHQLRGRVGRGVHHSYCVLIGSSGNAESLDRLRVLEQTVDGFRIAEADLELRGPGDLLGARQSGLMALRLGNLASDAPLVSRARERALEVLARDPDLCLPANRPVRDLLVDLDAADAIN